MAGVKRLSSSGVMARQLSPSNWTHVYTSSSVVAVILEVAALCFRPALLLGIITPSANAREGSVCQAFHSQFSRSTTDSLHPTSGHELQG